MNGRIVTFYSWKGGVGRTMAMANTGVQLARRGKRVLLVDWDLEAPGLERYFANANNEATSLLSITKPSDESGLLGLLCSLASDSPQEIDPITWQNRRMTVAVPMLPETNRTSEGQPTPQPLHLIGSGIRSTEYANNLQSFSWIEFFAEKNGGLFLEQLREQWREAYDLVLIDSRTGLTDSGGVCTIQMPDLLVLVFTANTQSLDDGLAFLDGVQKARADFAFERSPLTFIPLLARWEGNKEVDLADAWLARMESTISRLVDNWLPVDFPVKRMLEKLRVPHVARFSFGEPLPVLTHSISDSALPGLTYDILSKVLADGFSNVGSIIDPGYKPVFDPLLATNAEIDALVSNNEALDIAIKNIAKISADECSDKVERLMRLAKGGIRIGRLAIADDITQQATSIIRQRLTTGKNPSPKDNKAYMNALLLQGEILQAQGRLVETMLAYQESIKIIREFAKADPTNATWQRNLNVSHSKIGDVLLEQGDLEGALTSYRESLSVSQRLTSTDLTNNTWQRDLNMGYSKIGDVLLYQGCLEEALASFRESLYLSQRLASADQTNADLQRDLSVSYDRIGEVLLEQGDFEEALTSFRESLHVRQCLASADPTNAEWQRDLSVSQERIGDVLLEKGDLEGALTSYRESLSVSQRLASTDPTNATWQRDLSVSYDRIGEVQLLQGDLNGALISFRESLSMSQRLASTDPTNATWQRDLSVSHDRIGDVLLDQDDLDGALTSYRESLSLRKHFLRKRLTSTDPNNAMWRHDLSVSFTKIAQVYEQQGKPEMALPFAEESLLIDERLSILDKSNITWQKDVEVSRNMVRRLREAIGQSEKS